MVVLATRLWHDGVNQPTGVIMNSPKLDETSLNEVSGGQAPMPVKTGAADFVDLPTVEPEGHVGVIISY
jgi:hypothetical protein